MRKFRKWILAAALIALAAWAPPARPADKEGKDTERYVPEEEVVEVVLLRHKSVRDALKLSDADAKKIHDFTARQWKRAKELHGQSEDKRSAAFKEMAKENEKFLQDTLTPEQRKRLNQITMQVAGLLWVTRPDVASELKLTDAQKKQAHELQQKAHKEMETILHSGTAEGREEKIRALHAASRKNLMNLLTDDQKATWKKMVGEPFKGELHKD